MSPPVTNRSVLYVVPMRDDEIIAEKTTDDDDFVGRCGAGAFHYYDSAKSETAVGHSEPLAPWPLALGWPVGTIISLDDVIILFWETGKALPSIQITHTVCARWWGCLHTLSHSRPS